MFHVNIIKQGMNQSKFLSQHVYIRSSIECDVSVQGCHVCNSSTEVFWNHLSPRSLDVSSSMLIASTLWQAGISDGSCELEGAEPWHRIWYV